MPIIIDNIIVFIKLCVGILCTIFTYL